MKLYLLRHGLAGSADRQAWPDDTLRPLTPEGRRRSRALGRWMRRQAIAPDIILSSDLLRARQTAELVAAELRLAKHLARVSHLAPEGDIRKLVRHLATLRPAPREVLLVGHEPQLSAIVSVLCTGGPALRLRFKKGGLCRMEVDRIRFGSCATLEWHLPPAATVGARR